MVLAPAEASGSPQGGLAKCNPPSFCGKVRRRNTLRYCALRATPIASMRLKTGVSPYSSFNPYANALPVAPYYLYDRNLPVIPMATQSPLRSALRVIFVSKSIADMMPSPNSSSISAFGAGPPTGATSGNDPLRAELPHEPHEHRFAVDHVVEAEAARFGDVRHHVPVAAEDVIGKGPSHQVIIGVGQQPMFLRHGAPKRRLVRHVCRQACGANVAGRHVESGGELRPQIFPAEIIAVGDVERFEAAARLGRRPQRGVGEVLRRGDLIDRGISAGLARKMQRPARLLADRGVHRDGRRQTHRGAWRKAAQGLRPQLHPVPALVALEGGEPVDLVEIIVRARVARIALARRRPERP